MASSYATFPAAPIRSTNRPSLLTAAGSAAPPSRRGTWPTSPTRRGPSGTAPWPARDFHPSRRCPATCGTGESTWIGWLCWTTTRVCRGSRSPRCCPRRGSGRPARTSAKRCTATATTPCSSPRLLASSTATSSSSVPPASSPAAPRTRRRRSSSTFLPCLEACAPERDGRSTRAVSPLTRGTLPVTDPDGARCRPRHVSQVDPSPVIPDRRPQWQTEPSTHRSTHRQGLDESIEEQSPTFTATPSSTRGPSRGYQDSGGSSRLPPTTFRCWPLPRRRGLQPSASARGRRPNPLRHGHDLGRGEATGAARLDRASWSHTR